MAKAWQIEAKVEGPPVLIPRMLSHWVEFGLLIIRERGLVQLSFRVVDGSVKLHRQVKDNLVILE
jgi:hypothetical protein